MLTIVNLNPWGGLGEVRGRSGGGQGEVGGGRGEVRGRSGKVSGRSGQVCLMQFNSMYVGVQDLVVHRHHSSTVVMLVHSLVCVANSV